MFSHEILSHGQPRFYLRASWILLNASSLLQAGVYAWGARAPSPAGCHTCDHVILAVSPQIQPWGHLGDEANPPIPG